MKKYSHLFFDLDHTLWDYERNSEATLRILYDQFSLNQNSTFSIEEFILKFTEVNEKLWDLYHIGKIGQDDIRKERFKSVFNSLGLNFDGTEEFSAEYIAECPKMGATLPGAIELLEYLSGTYKLNIITNGFVDIQEIKLNTSGLYKYFDKIVISGHTDYRKPDREIFLHALNETNGKPETSVMIGDSLESDIRGAKNVPMDQVFFNPKKTTNSEEVTYEINHLLELKTLGF